MIASANSGLNQRYFFRKENRVLKRRDFLDAYEHGTAFRRRAAHVFVREREASSLPARLGITATLKVGKAVQRNRLKRIAREVFRLALPQLRSGYTVIINYHRAAAQMTFHEIQQQLHSVWHEAGLFRDDAPVP